jgi:hypothetical protein
MVQACGVGAVADHRGEFGRYAPSPLRFDQCLEIAPAAGDENDETGRFQA